MWQKKTDKNPDNRMMKSNKSYCQIKSAILILSLVKNWETDDAYDFQNKKKALMPYESNHHQNIPI